MTRQGRKPFCSPCTRPVLMAANVEAVEIFNVVSLFIGMNGELPSCMPWLFEIYDIADERVMLEKIMILHETAREAREKRDA